VAIHGKEGHAPMKKSHPSKPQAFTLIELLVVIAIIGKLSQAGARPGGILAYWQLLIPD
jgi:prepilin-type N-terminal cleavage/methylation domain-containing protein